MKFSIEGSKYYADKINWRRKGWQLNNIGDWYLKDALSSWAIQYFFNGFTFLNYLQKYEYICKVLYICTP